MCVLCGGLAVTTNMHEAKMINVASTKQKKPELGRRFVGPSFRFIH